MVSYFAWKTFELLQSQEQVPFCVCLYEVSAYHFAFLSSK